MIIVTGGAGFIGSNIVKELNNRGRNDILVVDDLTDGRKVRNLQNLDFYDYIDCEDFDEAVALNTFDCGSIEVVFHDGACADTMEYDGKYMMKNNFEGTKNLFHYCQERRVPMIYASSASTYGSGKNGFTENPSCEEALNPYAYSKLFFDRYLRKFEGCLESQVVGLRYFNVYGPNESHKDNMASLVRQMFYKLCETGEITLFKGTDGYADGEQKRDFIYVKDVVNVNLFFWEHPEISGIFNCGTGQAHTFNEFMQAVIDYHGSGQIRYIPFPEVLKGKYQSYTEADTTKLMAVGYDKGFTKLTDAVHEYCELLDNNEGYLR
ncbi:ADP-glyceromanno-heptose 6-epimerase [Veillonella montpellierensis]|uniref:ADP-glyceromanno-heptose 6-epimerase n=1 Tax=Veillonella montpellierensis TaxID=187328 RepID=UPI0023F987CB|nr:ADP-glyceromanno-heptose 6-epimerase [Veillonella montpellierensis]